jgi:hypothetical protein
MAKNELFYSNLNAESYKPKTVEYWSGGVME